MSIPTEQQSFDPGEHPDAPLVVEDQHVDAPPVDVPTDGADPQAFDVDLDALLADEDGDA